jgi:hypothetical protein
LIADSGYHSSSSSIVSLFQNYTEVCHLEVGAGTAIGTFAGKIKPSCDASNTFKQQLNHSATASALSNGFVDNI